MEQREYDTLETRIDEADARLRAAQQRVQADEVVLDPQALTAALAELEAAQASHHAVYQRWIQLTEKMGG
jgi:ATP-binding cassette subfamily F protein uup